MKVILRACFAEESMPDQDGAEWTKVVADFETSGGRFKPSFESGNRSYGNGWPWSGRN